MVNPITNPALLVAALDLKEVQLLRQAIQNADASQARVSTDRQSGPREACDCFCPREWFANRPIIHPTPRYEPRPVIHPAPRVDPCPPRIECVPAEDPVGRPASIEGPLPAPWMPGFVPGPDHARPLHAASRVKITPLHPDKTVKGAMLDVFI